MRLSVPRLLFDPMCRTVSLFLSEALEGCRRSATRQKWFLLPTVEARRGRLGERRGEKRGGGGKEYFIAAADPANGSGV